MYNFKEIEQKWQKKWEEDGVFEAKEDKKVPKNKRKYILDMFPYPSAQGLHVGHPEGYTASDILSRYYKMRGFNVLHPIGWDAFGLPAENYAIKTGRHPRATTEENIARMKKQIQSLGFAYDWSREINTTDPAYYKWTQWIFLQMWKHDLAYEAVVPINWCPKDKTGLANEEVINGKCERCGTPVEKKDVRQWMLRITKYAERLLEDLDGLDWPEKIKEMQKNWIGKSEGAEIQFGITNYELRIKVFTTRVDTIFGVSAVVLAPEHPLITNDELLIMNKQEVNKYIKAAKNKSDLERTELEKEKTGVELKGVKAINPFSGEEVPVWVADYVLSGYGTGAVMMVPAHDERDFAFAKKYKLPIKEVVTSEENNLDKPFTKAGILTDSGEFTGMKSAEAKEKMIKFAEKKGFGEKKINYHLRDWVFSRQRYWGEPIPLVHCEKCGIVSVPEEELPLTLPEVEKYEPTGTGESPLAGISDWVNTKCPKCGGKAKRETNTMPQWAGSCWYYIRYTDPKNEKALASESAMEYWLPVDIYIGGAEHAVLHLLYARFWHKFLFDIGVVKDKEPFFKLKNQGLILGEDGVKMSKSRGNVVNPDEIVNEYGADTMRLYEMFMGPFEDAKPWDTKSIIGIKRFLEKVWNFSSTAIASETESSAAIPSQLEKTLHKTIKGVSDDIENFKFNTAISKMMIFVNETNSDPFLWKREAGRDFLKLLAPFAPHISEEIWASFGNKKSIFLSDWPKYDPGLAKDDEFELIIQVNSKVRDKIVVAVGISEKEAKELALASEKIKPWLVGQTPKKIIFTGKLVNIVV